MAEPQAKIAFRGVLPVVKPQGPTSHDVVARLRRIAHTRRVGHTGTLDPMAQGVLLCCIGEATRIARFLTGLAKEYEGEIRLGARTATYDAESEIVPVRDPSFVAADDLRQVFASLTGAFEQKAPPYSAVKVAGKKLYEYARKGEETVPEKIRTAFVHSFDLLEYDPPRVLFRAKVASGVYIRSMAHEVGERLGCGAYLSALARTGIGSFRIEDCASLERLEDDPGLLAESLLSIPEALTHLPKVIVVGETAERLVRGHPFGVERILESETAPPDAQPVLVLSPAGEALAIVEKRPGEERFRPICVLAATPRAESRGT